MAIPTGAELVLVILRNGSLWSEQFLQDYIGNQESYRDKVINLARNKNLIRAFEKELLPFYVNYYA